MWKQIKHLKRFSTNLEAIGKFSLFLRDQHTHIVSSKMLMQNSMLEIVYRVWSKQSTICRFRSLFGFAPTIKWNAHCDQAFRGVCQSRRLSFRKLNKWNSFGDWHRHFYFLYTYKYYAMIRIVQCPMGCVYFVLCVCCGFLTSKSVPVSHDLTE